MRLYCNPPESSHDARIRVGVETILALIINKSGP